MALQNTLRRAGPFTGTGLVSTYPFAFKVFAEADVAVTVSSDPNGLVEETLKLNADYTVSLNEDQDGMPGGSITLAVPLAVNTRLTINSVVPADQQMELTNHDGFFPTVINTAFDKATALIQQLEEKLTRAVTVPTTSTDTPEQLAKDLFDARDRAEAADKNAAASASASASSAATSKSYADKVTDFKEQIITVSDNMADVKTNAANVAAIKGISDNLPEVLKSSQYAAEAKNWAEQASAIAGSEALMMPGAYTALNIREWIFRKAQVFNSVAEMKASGVLGEGMAAMTLGYYEPGDGGMAFYRARTMTADDVDDGGSIHTLPYGMCSELIVENGTVNVRQFGAKGAKGTDDSAAFQEAINFARRTYGNSVFIPKGVFYVSNVTVGSTHNLKIYGEGYKSVISAYSQDCSVLKVSARYCHVSDLRITSQGNGGVVGLKLNGAYQNYNTFDNLFIEGCDDGIVLKGGTCYYNRFKDIWITDGIRGIVLDTPDEVGTPNNRNQFTSITMTSLNTGVWLKSGDTNSFIACNFENISKAGYLDPCAVRIESSKTGYNRFISCTFESNSLDVINPVDSNAFILCNYFGKKVKYNSSYPYPRRSVEIPNDATMSFVSIGPLLCRSNDSIPEELSGKIDYGTNVIGAEFFDYGYKYKSYPINVSNTHNITEIGGFNSYYQRLGSFVDWSFRGNFCASATDAVIKFTLPVAAHLNANCTYSYVTGMRIPIALTLTSDNGVVDTVGFIAFSSAADDAGLVVFVTPPAGTKWYTNGPYNKIFATIRYRSA